ncbi:hypothetical protein HDU98_006601 [Podochytrium sp. JEL0797]|nr:hypothetical protein HDU98_006601 [Podochytrium sp. JEL0797]
MFSTTAAVIGGLYAITFLSYKLGGVKLERGCLPLNPERVIKVNMAFLQHFLGILISPVMAIYSRYFLHKSTFVNGIVYGPNPRLKLDVHGSGTSPDGTLKPVIVFIYGGAWSSGSRALYAPLADTMAKSGLVVVVFDYTLFPVGKVEEMVTDVANALVWTHANVERYGGDAAQISLMGHSAGAHLAALTLVLGLYAETGREFCSSNTSSDVAPLAVGLPDVRGVVLLSGVFSIHDHFGFEAARGVEYISAMARCMGHSKESFDARSPGELLQNLCGNRMSASTLQRRNDAVAQHLPKHWLLIHGSGDNTVSVSQTVEFHNVLRHGVGVEGAVLKVFHGMDHSTPVLLPMSMDSDYTCLFLSELHNMIAASQSPAGGCGVTCE